MAGKKKVLVIDDEPDAIEFARAVLEEAGYDVLSAEDGKKGLEIAKDSPPGLVLLDLEMPGQLGYWILTELRETPTTKDVPVVIVTGIAQRSGVGFTEKDVDYLSGHKPDAYLEKPVDPDRLKKIVKKLIR